jgi:TM2 domain-containing membrane protein YozV
MADGWYYAQNQERRGPVSFAKLKAMAGDGWLRREELVWHAGMPEWTAAEKVPGLFASSLGQLMQDTIAGVRAPVEAKPTEAQQATQPPNIPAEIHKPIKANKPRPKSKQAEIDWDDIQPRHVLAACGGFLAALGIAFTAIAQSRLALAFTLSGLFIAAVGLYVEIGSLLGQAIENIGKASKEAADRRLRAKELAIEKQRLDLEAAKLAQEQAAREAPAVPAAPATVLANQPTGYVPEGQAIPGQVVVINQPPVQRWSPGLAAVLSFFLPGLGQLYKGQFINAIVWFFAVMCGYAALILPGLVLHFFCVLGALSGNPWSEGKTMVVRQ